MADIVRSAITDRLDRGAYDAVQAQGEAINAQFRRVLLPVSAEFDERLYES